MKKRFEKHKANKIIGLLGLYGRNFGAMAMGSFAVIVLNMVTPLEFFKVQRAHFILVLHRISGGKNELRQR